MKFFALEAQKPEDNAHLVDQLLTAKKYDDIVPESSFAQGNKEGRSFSFLPGANSHELLHQATGHTSFGVDE
jgi:hypothetical protein